MAKVLFITYSYPPDTSPAAQRPYFFKKYCESELIIVTASAAHEDLSDVIRTSQGSAASMNLRSVSSKKKGLLYRLFLEFLIPDKGVFWYRSALLAARKVLSKNPDIELVMSSSPSVVSHLVAKRIAKEFNAKWVADYRDFYYLNVIERKNFVFRKRIDRFLERGIMGFADMHVFISDSMRESYCNAYDMLNATNACTIYNGYDPAEFDFEIECNSSSKLRILYAGSFYDGVRPPQPLFHVLDYLISTDSLNLRDLEILVAGPVDESVREIARDFICGHALDWLGPLSREKTLRLMKEVDLLWLITADHPDHYLGVPLKAYEYMGSGTSIVSFGPNEAEVKHILESSSAGIHLPLSTTKNDVIASAERLQSQLESPVQVEHAALKKYRRSGQAQQLDQVISDLLKS